jgi:Fe-Mn family superoxide dismutase
MASLFNHASMAHNNHFFFSCLSTQKVEMPLSLKSHLETSFSSIETLRKEFIATANAMFGPGFVWLVRAKGQGPFYLLTTYIAGSPYPGAHWRRQPVDMNTEADMKTPADHTRAEVVRNMAISNTVGIMGPYSATGKMAPGGIDIVPVLCANTWQHAYLADWGILQKKKYLEAWWDRIDWNVVANNAGETAKPQQVYFR